MTLYDVLDDSYQRTYLGRFHKAAAKVNISSVLSVFRMEQRQPLNGIL